MRAFSRSTVAASILVALFSIGCEGDHRSPTAPPAPQPSPTVGKGWVWGHVVEKGSGQCIVGAVVQIVEGPNVGQKDVQDKPCSVWEDEGYELRDLPFGVPIMLRATSEGYHPVEREVFAYSGGYGIDIELRKE